MPVDALSCRGLLISWQMNDSVRTNEWQAIAWLSNAPFKQDSSTFRCVEIAANSLNLVLLWLEVAFRDLAALPHPVSILL